MLDHSEKDNPLPSVREILTTSGSAPRIRLRMAWTWPIWLGARLRGRASGLPSKKVKATAGLLRSGIEMKGQEFHAMVPTNAAEYAARYDNLARINADGS